jgi:uncharacterized membrane protein YozB (DUF420 family)
MSTADLNAVLSVVILVLIVVAAWQSREDEVLRFPVLLAGLAFITLGLVQVVSSLGIIVIDSQDIEAVRFSAAALRTVALIFLLGYVWHRWRESRCRPDCDE